MIATPLRDISLPQGQGIDEAGEIGVLRGMDETGRPKGLEG